MFVKYDVLCRRSGSLVLGRILQLYEGRRIDHVADHQRSHLPLRSAHVRAVEQPAGRGKYIHNAHTLYTHYLHTSVDQSPRLYFFNYAKDPDMSSSVIIIIIVTYNKISKK